MPQLQNVYGDSSRATFIVPSDEVSRQKCLEVEAITAEWLKKKCNIFLKRDFSFNTVASVYLEEMMGFLGLLINRNPENAENQVVTLNGIIDAYSSLKDDERAEKEGNINLKICLGNRYYYPEDLEKDLVEYPYDDKQYYRVLIPSTLRDKGEFETTKILDRMTQQKLNQKYRLTIMQPLLAETITSAFITSVIQWTIETCEKIGKPVLYNISDIIECRCVVKDGDPVIHFVPGEGAKLAVKYDGQTEEE